MLTVLKVEAAKVDGERKTVEADLGSVVRYLATLLGSNDDQTRRYFILVVALLLDPAAVLPLRAATIGGADDQRPEARSGQAGIVLDLNPRMLLQ
jgi:hypothetical protein